MVAAIKIVALVIADRLRKLEMANMAAAASIAVALHLDFADVTIRVAFAFLLNALVYLNNDYIDVHLDLSSPDKDTKKAQHLADNIRAAFWAQVAMAVVLAAAAVLLDIGLLVPLIAGGGVCVWYSAVLKRKPYVDILAMMVWGLAMPLCGVPLGSTLGWVMAGQLGLFSGVFESIQVMRDADDGKEKTLWLARVIMGGVAVYGALWLHPIAGLIGGSAFLVPYHEDRIVQYWTRVKLVYGMMWLFVCGFVFINGQSAGLLGAISALAGAP
jgi:hypothetical protein